MPAHGSGLREPRAPSRCPRAHSVRPHGSSGRRLAELRARRDGAAVERALDSLERAAGGSENLVPRILECVKSDVTVGEICHRLRAVFGEYEETVTL
ncbi:MAG: hypothetical protein HYY89_00355 [candidate division NC10 bacterium]|nr:hypothetical protein [candidate division NC10 bacterium]